MKHLESKAETIRKINEYKKKYEGTWAPLESCQIAINEEALALRDEVSVFFKDEPEYKEMLINDLKSISRVTTERTIRSPHGMRV